MRLAIDTSGAEQAMVVLDGHRLLAAEDWVRSRDDAPVLARLDALVKRAGQRRPASRARMLVEAAGMLATSSPGHAHREIPPAGRRTLSPALLDSAIWTFESQKPLRYDEVQALSVQPAAAEERRRKAR